MLAATGQALLVLALVLALVQAFAPLVGAQARHGRGGARLMALGRFAALWQAATVAAAFATLVLAYLANDFSIALVAAHSNRAQPWIYRLGAAWGSHEGSMLLWVLILAVYGAAIAVFGVKSLRESFQARVLAVQGMLGAAFLGFLVLTSNPFTRLPFPAADGAELNPVLQDPGLIFHPPLLYLGYVGFSLAFSFGMAALIEGEVDHAWARWVRPWVLLSWCCLTVGIAGGSLWAYYSLGWGGWWFWDPVENASFMPWLLGTALLHSALVLERRRALISWTILLSILTFSLSLVGTFLVRSGILTSVHAFALDARRGVYILIIIAAFTGAGLILFGLRAGAMRTGAFFAPVSREAAMTLNNLFLLTCAATVFLGTFYPVFVEALNGEAISVGPPFYKITFIPLFLPLLAICGVGPMLNWRGDDPRRLAKRLGWPFAVGLGVLAAGSFALGLAKPLNLVALALGAWLIAASLAVLIRRWRGPAHAGERRLARLAATPLAAWAMSLAHAGLGVTAVGIAAATGWQADKVLAMSRGESVAFAGRAYRLDDLRLAAGPNYAAGQARFTVAGPLGARTLTAERRLFPVSGARTTAAAIGLSPLGDTYISIGDLQPDGRLVVRLYHHPLIGWIWGGALIMAAGGAISLADRGVRRARSRRKARAPAAGVAAESAAA